MSRNRRTLLPIAALVALAATVTAAPSLAAKQAWKPDPAKYGDVVVQNVHIRMSDGIDLVGDVEYPADKATGNASPDHFPVLLTQNPYVCQVPASGSNTYYVDRGYIFATVCVRGTGRSGGKFGFMSRRDQLDGVELVNWAAHDLPGSNGIVGLTGCSYLGLTQIFTAGALPANSPVKEIAPSCAGTDMYRESADSGGVPTESVEYMFPGITALIGARAGVYGTKTVASGLLGGDPAYDGTFWTSRTPGAYAAHIAALHIPALMWSGWSDIFTRTSEEMYAYLQNAAAGRPVYGPMAVGQKASPMYQIVVGPWGHGQGIDQTIQLEWYDTWLKGEDTPLGRTHTPMHLYQLGTNTWINTADFPMVDKYTKYYLGGSGVLSTTAPKSRASDSLQFAPPQSSSLTYTTPAFKKGATLAGPISATITASTSGTNMDIITSLFDVAPDGTATQITQGNLAGSFATYNKSRSWYDANGVDINPYPLYDQDRWLTAGKPVQLDITISPRVYSVAPGHKLQVVLTTMQDESKCGALLGVHPCFPSPSQLRTFPGTYTVLRGAGQQSTINLPLLPFGFFKPTGGHGAEPAGV
ncbi:MAG TPA: CocE/NonD family hydrolase [Mycobacteriales bacterium]|nr:CocE/NonD family hydrolase [Mycobacteriales bacterium]